MKKLIVPLLATLSLSALAQTQQVIPVIALNASPAIDGNIDEWGDDGWVEVQVKPALPRDERGEYGLDPAGDRNATGNVTVKIKAGVADERFFLAVRYPDEAEDTVHKEWAWRSDRYRRGTQQEDMLALRFHIDGDFDRSMLSKSEYSTDVWLWSAARTNPSGIAEDMVHSFTTQLTEMAAEYEASDGTGIYITKRRDDGVPPYDIVQRPRENMGDTVPSFEIVEPSGSAGDVAAKGVWKGGFWSVEFGRALNTGNADDVAFKRGQSILGQIAVFNKGSDEHKSVSEPLLFDFAAIQ